MTDPEKNPATEPLNPQNASQSESDRRESEGKAKGERRERDAARFFLAAIVDSSQDSIVTIDFDGIITTWNAAAEQLYGYPAAEAIGQSLMELTLPHKIKEVLANIEKVRHSQQAEVFDSLRINKSGQEMHLEVVMSPVKDDEAKVIGVSTIARDVTARKLLEQELEKQVQERTRSLQDEVGRRRQLQEQRTQLLQRIVNAQEAERRRVSRELHDNLGQHLTAILLHIRSLQTESRDTQGGSHFIEERRISMQGLSKLAEMMDDLTSVAHRLAWELRPAVLDNLGLKAALEQYVGNWSEQGIAADFVSRGDESQVGISGDVETTLFRVTQEALTNVQRHAQASRVGVILERRRQSVSVIVEDNGVGFNADAESARNRLGISGMRERLELVGGTLEVESEPGSGTTVYACVPLPAA